MALTPVEIRHIKPPRTKFGGYRTGPVEKILEEVVTSFEDVWRERADLADKVEQLEADLIRFRELETLLRTTLVSAEQASEHVKDQARREAELILSEAHAEAREIHRRAVGEHERLQTDARRIRAQLAEALAVLEEEPAAEDEAQPEVEETTAEPGWLVIPDADAA
jgi:cell division initiation protein